MRRAWKAPAAALLLAGLALAAPLDGQQIPDVSETAEPPAAQLTLTAHMIGGTLGYGRAIRPGRYLGGEIGLGGDLWSTMLFAGRHFAEGPSYEARDPYDDESLFEVVHAAAFLRLAPNDRIDADLGLRASLFLHWNEVDDDPGGGAFGGVYGTFMIGWRHFKVGPRVQAGVFHESPGAREFGIYLVPLTARLMIGG